ncbi:hypothetical protein K1W54_04600 [Micromonospora sp. CPCC 205371]|nr:hypothetical protein [Micromonospora sp. CPCC 205371]
MILSTLAPIVTGIGAAVRDALADTPEGIPERVCLLVPGAIAADACDCGQLALSITRIFQSATFPLEATTDQAAAGCPPPVLAATVTVSLFRCAPTVDDDLDPPSCDALLASAVGWDTDVAAIRRALACKLGELADQDRIIGYVIGATLPVGPDGACLGADTTITIGINNCGCA